MEGVKAKEYSGIIVVWWFVDSEAHECRDGVREHRVKLWGDASDIFDVNADVMLQARTPIVSRAGTQNSSNLFIF